MRPWLRERAYGNYRYTQFERREGGHARAGRRDFRRGQRGSALGSGEALPRRAARRHAQNQGPLGSFRIGQEALEAEGYGAGPYRIDPVSAVAAWLHSAWTATALLRLQLPQEEADGRVALGAGREAGGRQADRGEFVRHEGSEDQGVPQVAGLAESRFHSSDYRGSEA